MSWDEMKERMVGEKMDKKIKEIEERVKNRYIPVFPKYQPESNPIADIEYLLSCIRSLKSQLYKAACDISFWREQHHDTCQKVIELESQLKVEWDDEKVKEIEVVIRWIPVLCKLPELNETVLIFRCQGQNKDHISLAYRQHKSKTQDEWEWLETTGYPYDYFGIAVDGSRVIYWAHLPEFPVYV